MKTSRRFLSAAALALVSLPCAALAVTDEFDADLAPHWATPSIRQAGGDVASDVANDDALDGSVLELMYPGGTSIEDAGPAFATEISTANERTYGVYEARLRTPKTNRMTGLVSSFFTYSNNGKDHDGDGLIDNHEIDIEFLANEPTVIYLSVWTEYQDGGGAGEQFRKTSRRIDMRSGRVWQTPAGGEGSYELEEIAPLPFKARKFQHSKRFYTYRFDWQADSVTYSIDLEDGEGFRTLWALAGAANVTIPSRVSPLRMNLWHNANHWLSGNSSRTPRRDVRYHIDRVTFP